ncbi:MAG: hypothetical protein QXO40_00200 [Candidatus Aenigmatarchaeota archaeon]
MKIINLNPNNVVIKTLPITLTWEISPSITYHPEYNRFFKIEIMNIDTGETQTYSVPDFRYDLKILKLDKKTKQIFELPPGRYKWRVKSILRWVIGNAVWEKDETEWSDWATFTYSPQEDFERQQPVERQQQVEKTKFKDYLLFIILGIIILLLIKKK